MSHTTKQAIKQSEQSLTVQDTLTMSEEERIDLLVHLIVDKIIADEKAGGTLFTTLQGADTW